MTPSALVVSGGDNQTGSAGRPLPGVLQVTLTGTDGRPFPGAAVTWQVTSGGGSVSAAVVTTDAYGAAATYLTLGRATGANRVSATVPGVAPVSLSATAVAGPPTEITALSGDHQSAARATALSQPIVVSVADAFGNRVANATVTFAASEGSFSPMTTPTDAQGQAQAVWTLGATIGSQAATAAAGALATVTLNATALDPCQTAAAVAYTISTTASGSLGPTDCVLSDGSYFDLYALSTTSFQSLRFDLRSSTFDATLGLYNGSGNIIAANDDAEGSLNSVIRLLARPDSYFVGANSFAGGETGPYVLTSAAVPQEIGVCQHDVHVWVTRGIQTSQQVESADCVSASGASYDHVFLVLHPGQSVMITMTSTAFDAVLQLWDLAPAPDALVASDDNGGGGTNALLLYTHTGSVATTYAIWAVTSVAGATGPYTVSIAAPTAQAQMRTDPSQTPRRARNGVWHPGAFKPAAKATAVSDPGAETAIQPAAGSGSTPTAPSGTSAFAASESRIDVSWQDNSTNEAGFEVYRSTSGPGGAFTLRASLAASVVSYSDVGLTAVTEYCYRVRAIRISGRKTSYSSFSTVACATTSAPPAPPEPPLGPSFTDATPSGSTQVLVWWADNSTTEDGFRVERSVDAGATWTSAGTLGPDTTQVIDAGRTSEQEVCHRVVAFNVHGDSPPSNIDCTTPPSGPTNLTGAIDPLTWEIVLTWTDNSAVEDIYEVWACSSLEGQTFCGPPDEFVPADATSHRFQWDGYSETYWVVARKDGGLSDPSNQVTPTIP